MGLRPTAHNMTPWLIVFLIWIIVRIAYLLIYQDRPSPDEVTGIVVQRSEELLRPLEVSEPQQPRWRDIAAVAYSQSFRDAFSYSDADSHRAEVRYEAQAPSLRGTLTAVGLKPSFAYQLKLVGLEPVRGVTEEDNAADPRAWSSWQLGRIGRWWCEDCQWNVTDAELAQHVDEGHEVRGYLLFDWLVTDAEGDTQHEFDLNSSLHVLWRVGQRERGPNDTPPRWYTVERPHGAYPASAAGAKQQVGLFGEWEPDRPLPGQLRMPPGRYHVGLNLTEETFHANLGENRALEGGGFWAWVLEAELEFEVRPSISRASCSGCLPGPHEGTAALWQRRDVDRK